jgi:hypothetical protein
MKKLPFIVLLALITTSNALAAQKPIKGTLNKLPSSGTKLLAISDDGKSTTVTLSKKSFSIIPPGASARLYLLKSGKITGQIVLSKCKGSSRTPTACSKTQVYTSFRAGKNLGTISKSGLVYLVKAVSLGSVIASTKTTAKNFIPVGLATNGLPSSQVARTALGVTALATTPTDVDKDGLVEALDIDDNGNGIIDNYDSVGVTQPENSFRVFSNLKLDMDASINLHATGLSTERVDAALRSVQTLAIAVAGGTGETTELDCGGLTYCSSGGTGEAPPNNGSSFPGTAGGTFDPDGDGFGTITKGATGDFQLATKAASSAISGGDTFIERVTSADGTERRIPGTLNFVFTSTPALKTIAINADAAQTIDYSVSVNRLGAINNCLSVPSSGPVSVTMVGWRPQRPGVSSAGESTHVDIGNSKITIDIPNAPTTTGAGGGAAGPGNCAVGTYLESDANLSMGGDGLQDNKGDIAADAANTYQFTVDVTGCLAAAPGGAIAWNPNEKLQLDLQFRSRDGDNSAQKFCLERAPAPT